MSETTAERRRRKAAAGAADQLAAGLGAWSGGVFAAGVVAPFVASLIGASTVGLANLVFLALCSLLVAAGVLAGAAWFKARAKLLDDDALVDKGGELTQDTHLSGPEARDG